MTNDYRQNNDCATQTPQKHIRSMSFNCFVPRVMVFNLQILSVLLLYWYRSY